MTSVREVVVTGLGATTPLGGDVASTWAAALAGQSGARTLENDWAERYGIPVTFAAQHQGQARGRPRAPRDQAHGPVRAVRDDRDARGLGRRRAARRSTATASVRSSRRASAASGPSLDGWDTLKERGARRMLPMTVPMLMPNSAVCLRLARDRRPRRCARARLRLRLGRRGHRVRRRHDPCRSRRHRRGRRHRGHDPPHAHRRVRGLAHPVAAQRRPAGRLAPLRRRPRRVRDRRGCGHRGPGERRARRGPRRTRLRPYRRRGPVLGRLPHHLPGPGGARTRSPR